MRGTTIGSSIIFFLRSFFVLSYPGSDGPQSTERIYVDVRSSIPRDLYVHRWIIIVNSFLSFFSFLNNWWFGMLARVHKSRLNLRTLMISFQKLNKTRETLNYRVHGGLKKLNKRRRAYGIVTILLPYRVKEEKNNRKILTSMHTYIIYAG